MGARRSLPARESAIVTFGVLGVAVVVVGLVAVFSVPEIIERLGFFRAEPSSSSCLQQYSRFQDFRRLGFPARSRHFVCRCHRARSERRERFQDVRRLGFPGGEAELAKFLGRWSVCVGLRVRVRCEVVEEEKKEKGVRGVGK